MFLKIVLPAPQPTFQMGKMIYAPANLNIFFRILHHLKQIGYPSHWLAETLANILSNTLETSARAPKSAPLDIKETQEMRKQTVRKTSVAPFVTEMTTLASIWLPALGFSLLRACNVPPASTIRKYSLTFNDVITAGSNFPHTVLVFADCSALGDGSAILMERPLRAFLLDRQDRDPDMRRPHFNALHSRGLHVVSTWISWTLAWGWIFLL
ncbi:uncharacterized protein K452DRAFT_305413 [Aplosporella prunicola CBS 121167]|uniref:Uncharacterized protein n=1 Tax=Aplosporella prunicola CBS 121167 TaxID=1176127 RepID=A0A6A6BMM8_9PEZI|nr:uncharacterized protein K452DRAFT_305413 [Aplosporella prunicola CBS 121167]KAF2145382.1 hypothetical protein K452DRAFT_305413 [Aplosporella prunicola CBS 121167]